jgi:hypothetical protein
MKRRSNARRPARRAPADRRRAKSRYRPPTEPLPRFSDFDSMEGWGEAAIAELLGRTRLPLDQLDRVPELPGVFAVFYEPESPPAEEELSRPRFLELLAEENLPLFLGAADFPSTLRERIFYVTEFLDEAAGISWSWFSAVVLPTARDDYCATAIQLDLEQQLTFTPWHWMRFDRLSSHQATELSSCALVLDADIYPTPPGGLQTE